MILKLILLACLLSDVLGAGLSRKQRIQLSKEEKQKYIELRRQGVDEVGHTAEAAAMRSYQLRKKKRKGLLRKKEASIAQVLFPGVSPTEYLDNSEILMFTDVGKYRGVFGVT